MPSICSRPGWDTLRLYEIAGRRPPSSLWDAKTRLPIRPKRFRDASRPFLGLIWDFTAGYWSPFGAMASGLWAGRVPDRIKAAASFPQLWPLISLGCLVYHRYWGEFGRLKDASPNNAQPCAAEKTPCKIEPTPWWHSAPPRMPGPQYTAHDRITMIMTNQCFVWILYLPWLASKTSIHHFSIFISCECP